MPISKENNSMKHITFPSMTDDYQGPFAIQHAYKFQKKANAQLGHG